MTRWMILLLLLPSLAGCTNNNANDEEQHLKAKIEKAVCVNTRTLSGMKVLANYGNGQYVDDYYPFNLGNRCNDEYVALASQNGVELVKKGTAYVLVKIGNSAVWSM